MVRRHQSRIRIVIAATGQIAAQTVQLMQVWGKSTTSISRAIARQSVGQTSTQSPQSVHSRESMSGSSARGITASTFARA
jgi:hypothetical protein